MIQVSVLFFPKRKKKKKPKIQLFHTYHEINNVRARTPNTLGLVNI